MDGKREAGNGNREGECSTWNTLESASLAEDPDDPSGRTRDRDCSKERKVGQLPGDSLRLGRPGKEASAGPEKGCAPHPVGEASDGPGGRESEGLPADFLDSGLEDRNIREAEIARDMAKKGCPFPSRLDERNRQIGPRNGQRQSREPGSRSDIHNSFAIRN